MPNLILHQSRCPPENGKAGGEQEGQVRGTRNHHLPRIHLSVQNQSWRSTALIDGRNLETIG